jgi:hypothetical protein
MKEYKGILIIRKKEHKSNKGVNGSYNKRTNKITLYDKFFLLDKVVQTSILEHEWSHSVRHNLSVLDRALWS